jgi:cytochrome c biogenesis protein CcdA
MKENDHRSFRLTEKLHEVPGVVAFLVKVSLICVFVGFCAGFLHDVLPVTVARALTVLLIIVLATLSIALFRVPKGSDRTTSDVSETSTRGIEGPAVDIVEE